MVYFREWVRVIEAVCGRRLFSGALGSEGVIAESRRTLEEEEKKIGQPKPSQQPSLSLLPIRVSAFFISTAEEGASIIVIRGSRVQILLAFECLPGSFPSVASLFYHGSGCWYRRSVLWMINVSK